MDDNGVISDRRDQEVAPGWEARYDTIKTIEYAETLATAVGYYLNQPDMIRAEADRLWAIYESLGAMLKLELAKKGHPIVDDAEEGGK